jgi:excisionase family DNA binding protein
MPAIEPLALSPRDAAAFLSVSKRTLSSYISTGRIVARKDGTRTLVDVASLREYYASLPTKTGSTPLVFARRTRPTRSRRGAAVERR